MATWAGMVVFGVSLSGGLAVVGIWNCGQVARTRLAGTRRLGSPEPPSATLSERSRDLRDAAARRPEVRRLQALRRSRRRSLDLPGFVDVTARSLAAGASLRAALVDAGDIVGGPIRDDMLALEQQIDAGRSLSTALDDWSRECGDGGVALVVTAAGLGIEFGRGMAAAFAGLATTLADRHEIAAEARAASSQARASAVMLSALPAGFVLMMSMVDPGVPRTLFLSPIGWACLAGATVLDGIGFVWMRSLLGSVA